MGTEYKLRRRPDEAPLAALPQPESALSALSRLVLEGASEQEMLDEAVGAAASVLELDMAQFMELGHDQHALCCRSAVGWPQPLLDGPTASAEAMASFTEFVLAVGGTVTVGEFATEDRFGLGPLLSELGVVSGIATVVRGRDATPLGALGGESRSKRLFQGSDRRSLQAIADLLSVALLRREESDRFRALVQDSGDLMAVLNDRAEVTYWNPATKRLFGREAGNVLGKSLWGFVHPEDLESAKETFAAALRRPGSQVTGTFRLSTASGEWRVLEGIGRNCFDDPSVRGLVVNARDVTYQANLARIMRTLSAGNHALVSATDELSLLTSLSEAITGPGGFPCAWVGYRQHDDAKTVRVMAFAGRRSAYIEGLLVTWGEDDHGRGIVGNAIRTEQTQVIDDLAIAPEFAPWREKAARAGLRSACALGLRVNGEVIGALAIYAEEPGAFGTEELSLLAELADDLSYGIGRLRDRASLKLSEERFRALAANAPIGIIDSAGVGELRFANARASEIVGLDIEDLMGSDRWLELVCPDDIPKLLALQERVRLGQRAEARYKLRRPDGAIRHLRLMVAPKGDGQGAGAVATLEDVTDEVRANEALAYQASHDPLTGLANRAVFLDTLGQELARRRVGGPGLAVLFLDIDHFKVVNDSLGHVVGDEVLREVAERFTHGARNADTVARMSGDEFVFIVHGVRQPEDAIKATERLYGLLARPIRTRGRELRLTASTGIVLPTSGAEPVAVLRDADAAMYRAKAGGRARWDVFDEELHHRSFRRLALEAELHQALARREFAVHYQPLVVPSNGLPCSAEALVRWNSPDRGLVPPSDFIPVAEESGLIGPIGQWVFEVAVAQMAAWQREARAPRLDHLAVNFSARQLDDPRMPEFVRRVLERYGVEPGRLCVEVTESVLMADSVATRRSLEAFRELGLPVAIDDFGTGYSSLAYLHTLPVTTVKIDRSFVERLGPGSSASAVVRAIIEMSHAMGLSVVAEGVSDSRLQALVSDLGCERAQGYNWARPMPAEEFAKWWRHARQPNGQRGQ
ncbi:MAG TPA: EAL domain-containing protein [Acidimicrobiales bacterium]|nr:EAL domain-containing protein [Acidimicrobiales bacterium]